MKETQLSLVRLASKVRHAMCRPAETQLKLIENHLSWLCQEFAAIERLRCRLGICAGRNWHGAARRVLDELRYRFSAVRTEVCRCEELLDQGHRHAPALRPVHEDLSQIEDEFGQVSYHHDDGFLYVVTDPIELEGIGLGRFEIRILLDRLAEGDPQDAIRVVALDPHPAASDPRVTHPHLSSERLCAGEATEPLRRALMSGRICDALLLVRSVLETYGSESPYVSLDDWEGTPCWDCGYPASEDATYWCQCCEHDVCDECIGYCRGCDINLCRGCLSKCSRCEEPFCESCLEACGECGEPCCGQCLEDGLCSACLENLEENDDEEHEDERGQPACLEGTAQAAEPVQT